MAEVELARPGGAGQFATYEWRPREVAGPGRGGVKIVKRKDQHSWLSRLGLRLRRYFATGLALLFPVVVTIYVLVLLFRFADGLLGRFINTYLLRSFGYTIPGLGLILTVVLILATGVLSAHFFGRSLIPWFERWFTNLPIVRHIYPSAKQMIEFAISEKRVAFKEAVLVEFPKEGQYAVGFITNEGLQMGDEKQEYVAVLVPNTPSPLSGFCLILPRSELIPLRMSVEEAVKLVVTGGVLTPRQLTS